MTQFRALVARLALRSLPACNFKLGHDQQSCAIQLNGSACIGSSWLKCRYLLAMFVYGSKCVPRSLLLILTPGLSNYSRQRHMPGRLSFLAGGIDSGDHLLNSCFSRLNSWCERPHRLPWCFAFLSDWSHHLRSPVMWTSGSFLSGPHLWTWIMLFPCWP